jgi:peptidoglycan/LPS O-acetylase OafA/YrhL
LLLEALRGVAAITVLLWHSMLGFFPQWSGIFPGSWPQDRALIGQVWFGLINGPAAVILFFVLSGFVLTRHFLITGDQKIILRGAIKRWPRLAGPVLVTTLVSWLLFRLGAYNFAEGDGATGSPWLATFANAFTVPFEPLFWGSVREGAVWTFFRGDSLYDTSLWTMRYEFIGSFISFGLALLVALLPKGRKLLRLGMIAVVFLLCWFAQPFYASFPAGVALAAFLPERRTALPGWAVPVFILTAIYLLGFSGTKIGAFVLAAWIFKSNVLAAHLLASVLLIVAIELAPEKSRKRLSGRFAELLGTLSFPLYLMHVLVLCSLGCATLLWATAWATGPYPNIIAASATIIGSVLAAIPLALFNKNWVVLVNMATDWLLSPPLSNTMPESASIAINAKP